MFSSARQENFYKLFPHRRIARNFLSERTDVGPREILRQNYAPNPEPEPVYETLPPDPRTDFPEIPEYGMPQPQFEETHITPQSQFREPHDLMETQHFHEAESEAPALPDDIEIEQAVHEASQPLEPSEIGTQEPFGLGAEAGQEFHAVQDAQPELYGSMDGQLPGEPLAEAEESLAAEANPFAEDIAGEMSEMAAADGFDPMQAQMPEALYADPSQMGGLEQRLHDPYLNPLFDPMFHQPMPLQPFFDPWMAPGF